MAIKIISIQLFTSLTLILILTLSLTTDASDQKQCTNIDTSVNSSINQLAITVEQLTQSKIDLPIEISKLKNMLSIQSDQNDLLLEKINTFCSTNLSHDELGDKLTNSFQQLQGELSSMLKEKTVGPYPKEKENSKIIINTEPPCKLKTKIYILADKTIFLNFTNLTVGRGAFKLVSLGIKITPDQEMKFMAILRTNRANATDAENVDEINKLKLIHQKVKEISTPEIINKINNGQMFSPQYEIVRNTDVNQDGSLIFAQPLAGGTLEGALKRKRKLSDKELTIISKQLIDEIYSLEKANYIQWDNKPDNVFLTGSEDNIVAVLSDFGFTADVHGQSTSRPIGTAGYIDPLYPVA
ncbi:MAG: hypothetical protein HQK53_11975 [Oligoflexia bacterium]|nr:hypothetical protein [Oligoflexia bacterium]